MTTIKNYKFYRGESWRFDFTVTGPDKAAIAIQPSDVIQLRVSKGSTRYLLLTRGAGIVVIDDGTIGLRGKCVAVITDAMQDSNSMRPTIYNYEVFYSGALGDSVQIKGDLTIDQSLKEKTP